jgi:two-component system chemotaxis response regulator CheB
MTKELRPDVIVMDANMPVMDGFEATRQIMVEVPTPIVIVSATVNVREVAVSLHALRVGALALLPKPTLRDRSDLDAQARQFTSSIRAMAGVRVVQRWRSKPPKPIIKGNLSAPISMIAIAASTGGPGAIYRVLSELPAELPVPVVVVQHIAVGFVEGLATWLNGASALTVKVAEQHERMEPGFVYIAPDSSHLGLVDSYVAQISHGPAIGGFRPSATFMFESVARMHSRGALAVVLTGMGEDGLPGLHAIHAAGGRILVQDEATSVVFGMPGAAVNAGIADAILPLDMVAPRLKSVIAQSNRPTVRQ